jgi:hypothetical protein
VPVVAWISPNILFVENIADGSAPGVASNLCTLSDRRMRLVYISCLSRSTVLLALVVFLVARLPKERIKLHIPKPQSIFEAPQGVCGNNPSPISHCSLRDWGVQPAGRSFRCIPAMLLSIYGVLGCSSRRRDFCTACYWPSRHASTDLLLIVDRAHAPTRPHKPAFHDLCCAMLAVMESLGLSDGNGASCSLYERSSGLHSWV